MRIALPLCLIVAATGCVTEPLVCTEEARSSVSLELVDESGSAISDAVVTYRVDGGAEENCESWGDGGYVCGFEVEGAFEITSTRLGYGTDVFTVDVTADECHVETQVIERTLQAMDCDASWVTGAVVTVTDGQGADVTSATVEWDLPNADMLPVPCEVIGGNQWACAHEVAGPVGISITNAGPYEAFYTMIDIEHDGCHSITENVSAVLQYLPD